MKIKCTCFIAEGIVPSLIPEKFLLLEILMYDVQPLHKYFILIKNL